MKMKTYLFALGFVLTGIGSVFALSGEELPEYQKEYDAYLKDLNVIAETGKAPLNPDLEADLAKMSSNDKILLTALRQEVTDEMILAQSDDAHIVDSVEIIRVPEEFQQDYAEVYKEEKKTISAQSLVESQNEVRKQIMENREIVNIADHINPFRLLKEVELSPLVDNSVRSPVSDDPMINAYFSQLKRPYVEGDEAEEAPVSENMGDQGIQIKNLGLRDSMFVD